MPICSDCSYCDFQPPPGDFEEVSMEEALADLEDPMTVDDPALLAGQLRCPECGSLNVLTD